MLCCCRADQKIQGCVLQMEKETYVQAHTDSFLFKVVCRHQSNSNWYLALYCTTCTVWLAYAKSCPVNINLINVKQATVGTVLNWSPVSAAGIYYTLISSWYNDMKDIEIKTCFHRKKLWLHMSVVLFIQRDIAHYSLLALHSSTTIGQTPPFSGWDRRC